MAYERLVKRLAGLFTRRTDGWGARSALVVAEVLAPLFADGRVSVRMTRLPLLPAEIVEGLALTTNRGESLDHLLLKRTAREWMRTEGAVDAREEVRGYDGRFDVYSHDADWIVECGNSSMQKLIDAICDEEHPRFTLVPYQATQRSDDSPRRLIAIDFAWDGSLCVELNEALLAQKRAAMGEIFRADRARRIAEAQARKLARKA